jgi:hypothetical protein
MELYLHSPNTTSWCGAQLKHSRVSISTSRRALLQELSPFPDRLWGPVLSDPFPWGVEGIEHAGAQLTSWCGTGAQGKFCNKSVLKAFWSQCSVVELFYYLHEEKLRTLFKQAAVCLLLPWYVISWFRGYRRHLDSTWREHKQVLREGVCIVLAKFIARLPE